MIKDTLKRFDEKFVVSTKVESGVWYKLKKQPAAEDIKQFISKEIEKALNDIVPEEKNAIWNDCREEIKNRIKKYCVKYV